jgi:hypothetical protein
MRTDIDCMFSLRLTRAERERLQTLAELTGRTPASVLRRLIYYAELPEGRRLLGDPVGDPNQTGDPKPQEVISL